MDQKLLFLFGSGNTLLGVIVGGLIVVIGQAIAARASRTAADLTVDATLSVAEIGNQTARLELRLKQSELIFDRQLSASERFLEKLEDWDDGTRDIFKLGHDKTKVPAMFFDGHVGMQRWDAEKILRSMRLVLPPAVTNAAKVVLNEGLDALVKHESNFYVRSGDDADHRHQTEQDRINALESFSRTREEFLSELQKLIQLEGND